MTKPEPNRARVVVAGDMPIDWNLARTTGPQGAAVRASYTHGGAALLGQLISTMSTQLLPSDGITVHAPPPPPSVSPLDGHLHHRHAVWARFPNGDRKVWRIEQRFGVDQATVAVDASQRTGPAKADLIVLHDTDLGFRESPQLWPLAMDHLDGDDQTRILLRTAGKIARGALWDRLRPHAERLIVVIRIDDLRTEDVRISRELSWERTAQELVWELLYNPRVSPLLQCAHLIVSFTTAGALVASAPSNAHVDSQFVLVFDPAAMERTWNEPYPGEMIGGLSVLITGIVQQLITTPAGEQPDLIAGAGSGIAAMRVLDSEGYDEVADQHGKLRLAFPTERMIQQLSKSQATLAQTRVPDPLRTRAVTRAAADAARDWTILKDRYPGEQLEELAFRIAREGGEHALKDVPRAQYSKLITFDRHEIEAFQSVRILIRHYLSEQTNHPRSIAVFGPPGSGKSWSVRQIAASVSLDGIEDLTFNLSQFDDPRELIAALHQVRDISLGGKLPLVFWDEFDTTRMTVGGKEPLGWLPHFLAPMQDGTFQDGQLTHHIGRAIFVFGGGLFRSMQNFANESACYGDAKAPDFVSRLSGYVNILGPNPIDEDAKSDPYYLVRRAVLLRSLLRRLAPDMFHQQDGLQVPNIDPGVLRALLLTKKYKHGARSVESIVAMSTFAGLQRFERSDLASEEQLELHVDAADFLDLVRLADIDAEMLERLAEAVHVLYCADRLASGASWAGGNDYLREQALLRPYAGRSWEPARADPMLVPYQALPDARKASICREVADLPNTLVASGFLTRPLSSAPAPGELVDLRCTLESAAVKRAAEHGDPAQLERASAALADMRRQDVTVEEFHDADVRFHVALAGASRNEPLHLLMLALRGAMSRYLIGCLRREPDLEATISNLIGEHEAILRAVQDHDGDRASELVREHVLGFYRRHLTA